MTKAGAAAPGSGLDPEEMLLGQRLAQEIVDRGLGVPASFFLEGLRPLNFVASQAVAFFLPVVKIISDRSKIDQFQRMLEKREAIPYILAEIHQLEEARRG